MALRSRTRRSVLLSQLATLGWVTATFAQAPPPATGGAPAAPPKSTVKSGQAMPASRMGPVIVDPPSVDFGVVGPNTKVETEVKLTNATDKILLIIASVPSCQCTSVDMKGVTIRPGETVPMPMSMTTSASTGIKMAGVTLMFQGHPDPVQVSIKSEVAYSVRAQPPFIDVQQSPKDAQNKPLPPQPLRGTVTLESLDGKPFRVLAVHGKPPQFEGFDPTKDEPRATYQMVYDFTGAPMGQIPAYVIVETDRSDCPVMDIRVRHEATHIRPNFKLAEFRATVGALKPGEVGHFDIEIKELKTVGIASVESKKPAQATATLASQKGDGESVLASIDITPTAGHTGLLYFPVTITTTDGRKTDLLVFGRVG